MKRLFAMILVLVLTLSACSGDSAQETTAPQGPAAVKTVDEFLAAIAPGAKIVLEPGEYRLDKAQDYGKSTNPYYTWYDLGMGNYELQLKGVDGLTIQGAGQELTQMTMEPRWANVISVLDSSDVTIQDMTLGHTQRAEVCEGGVIRIGSSQRTTLSNLGLYGCGSLGVHGFQSQGIYVLNCDIYDCSVGGTQLSECQDVQFRGTTFRSLGDETPVMQVMAMWGCDGVTVSGCSITDNYAECLVYAENTLGLELRDNAILSNRVSGAAFHFPVEGVIMDGNSFGENELRNWYTPNSFPGVDDQGNKLLVEEPDAEPAQVTPGVAAPVSTGEQKQVTVTTVDQFLAAIASDTCIVLKGSMFDLAQSKSYKQAQAAEIEQTEIYEVKDNPNYYWTNNFDGPCLVISGVENMTILAQGKDRTAATISADPRYADVLAFENCSAITLQGFTAGHSKEKGSCTGGVFLLRNCADFLVDNCGMYGCGTEGVSAESSRNIQIVNSEIYECSYTGIELSNCENVFISGTIIRDITNEWMDEAPFFTFRSSKNITLDGVALDGNYVGR